MKLNAYYLNAMRNLNLDTKLTSFIIAIIAIIVGTIAIMFLLACCRNFFRRKNLFKLKQIFGIFIGLCPVVAIWGAYQLLKNFVMSYNLPATETAFLTELEVALGSIASSLIHLLLVPIIMFFGLKAGMRIFAKK